MDNLTSFDTSGSNHLFTGLPFPSNPCDSLEAKLNLGPMDFFDSQEDCLTKDTSTPKEFMRFDENPVVSIGLLDKKIQKLPKRQKRCTKEDRPQTLAKSREKRSTKKPVYEYEATRIEEIERKKNNKAQKKSQIVREPPVKVGSMLSIPKSIPEGPFRANKPEESYYWRDWCLYFNQEMTTLSPEEFLIFLKIVYNKHPECISFEKGYAELKMVLPKNLEGVNPDLAKKLTCMVEQNVVYELFSGYIQEVKKMRTELKESL